MIESDNQWKQWYNSITRDQSKIHAHRSDHSKQVILCKSTSTMASMKAICVRMVTTDTLVGHYDFKIIWIN